MIEKTSENTKMAILRKTPFAHGTRPSDDGMPAAQVKKMFYTALVDEDNSLLSEMERMRVEANRDIDAKFDKEMVCDRVEENIDRTHVPSTLGLTRYVDRVGNVLRLYFSNLSVAPADWAALATVVGTYGYKAFIPLTGVTERMIPELCFAPDDAVKPQLATFCRCVAGGVEIYATEAIEEIVTVENLVCSVPTYYTVLIRAIGANVTVRDATGKTYADGDFVTVGATLHISVVAQSEYTLSAFAVNGTAYAASATATVESVDGTVRVVAEATEVVE